MKPSFVPNQEYKQVGADAQNADLIFFHVTWCPHCKKAMPIWEELVAEHQGKPINGVNVNFVSVDCDKDSAMADRYGIEGFPTIKLIKGDEVIEYDARPNKDTILEFLHSTLIVNIKFSQNTYFSTAFIRFFCLIQKSINVFLP